MPHEVTLQFGRTEEDTPRVINGKFDDNEWKILGRFVEYADDLANIELIREGGPGSLSINCSEEKGFSYSTNVPPDDRVIVLLHRLRPFVLNNEPTNFNRICNYLGKSLDDEGLRNFLKSLRGYYSGQRMQHLMRITSNNVVINSEETLLTWLNAHEYHKDSDKQKELESLHQILPLEASRAIFIMMLYDKARAITIACQFIKVLAGKQKSFSCKLE